MKFKTCQTKINPCKINQILQFLNVIIGSFLSKSYNGPCWGKHTSRVYTELSFLAWILIVFSNICSSRLLLEEKKENISRLHYYYSWNTFVWHINKAYSFLKVSLFEGLVFKNFDFIWKVDGKCNYPITLIFMIW